MTLLTFIIPVRHQKNARDWSLLKANLTQTIASISNQDHPDWRGIVVANDGADLPAMPSKFSVTRVTFPPNEIHERGTATKDDFLDVFRADKGRRVLAGMLSARDSKYYMIVDDDDFVSSRIASYVAKNEGEPGWVLKMGYIWSDGGRLLLGHHDFNGVCGTSLIIRSDVYGLPGSFEEASIDWIKDMLGSHRRVPAQLAQRGSVLKELPFYGAIYRVANRGSHSGTPGMVQSYFLNAGSVTRPRRFIRNLLRLRVVSSRIQQDYFGATR